MQPSVLEWCACRGMQHDAPQWHRRATGQLVYHHLAGSAESAQEPRPPCQLGQCQQGQSWLSMGRGKGRCETKELFSCDRLSILADDCLMELCAVLSSQHLRADQAQIPTCPIQDNATLLEPMCANCMLQRQFMAPHLCCMS